ncbi:HlyD family efflux transporter periplasmic adaptor subunit [Sphingomonas limnosediminicola]|jgi:HlyD family secretion protein|uniref:HlyD family efflux transporter periplasmic adaptor subunit n=1 Tax=Sphingomonas limnosediminicola TaxID=940133 RepID=A0ABP7LVM2_9SPHN
MKRPLITGPRILLALLLLAVAAAVTFALHKPPVAVEIAEVSKGPLTVTVDDLGETRVRDLFVVSAPVTGRLLRVPLKPGTAVTPRATVLARIQPMQPAPLDARAYAQAQAEVRSLDDRLAADREKISELRAELAFAERDFARTSDLSSRGFISKASLDRARSARDRGRAAVAEAVRSAEATAHNLEAARAALLSSTSASNGEAPVNVTSPVAGYILQVPQESERTVAAGTPLVEIGDPKKLEIVADLLSSDAVRVKPGAAVLIEDWGGERALNGRVRLVEPYGFTKVSALGVEEQRVNVVIDFIEPFDAIQRLGHGYRATVRIVTWSAPNILKVPISALFRSGGEWSVFTVDSEGRARLKKVMVGHMNDSSAEVLGGLSAGEKVLLHPSDKVRDGIKVAQRT